MSWHDEIPFFPRHELACKGTGIVKLDERFAAHLPALRADWGSPLIPTSVCRTPEHNTLIGGHVRSLHLTINPAHKTDGTMAADIKWNYWSIPKRLEFAQLAFSKGWSVGLHNVFIHIDRRKDIGLQQAVFLYGSWSGWFNPGAVIT